jgi:hypothetical protein
MKPFIHSGVSVRKWGGMPDDYQEIHDFLDISKSASADMRHRVLLHHSMGPYIAERVFGITITNSDGKEVSVRDIAEQHIMDDMGGVIPSFDQWVKELNMKSWMGNPSITTKVFTLDQLREGLEAGLEIRYSD